MKLLSDSDKKQAKITELGKSSKKKTKGKKKNQSWVKRHEPKTFDDYCGNYRILNAVKYDIKNDSLKNLLFYGDFGTGKSLLSLIIPRYLYKPAHIKVMVKWVNASDKTKKDYYVTVIKKFATSKGLFNYGRKMVILDECDQMSDPAMKQLKGLMDGSANNVVWILITNYVEKLEGGLISRCDAYRFEPLSTTDVISNLQRILVAEGLTLPDRDLEEIAWEAKGDVRKSINLLQRKIGEIEGAKIHLKPKRNKPDDQDPQPREKPSKQQETPTTPKPTPKPQPKPTPALPQSPAIKIHKRIASTKADAIIPSSETPITDDDCPTCKSPTTQKTETHFFFSEHIDPTIHPTESVEDANLEYLNAYKRKVHEIAKMFDYTVTVTHKENRKKKIYQLIITMGQSSETIDVLDIGSGDVVTPILTTDQLFNLLESKMHSLMSNLP